MPKRKNDDNKNNKNNKNKRNKNSGNDGSGNKVNKNNKKRNLFLLFDFPNLGDYPPLPPKEPPVKEKEKYKRLEGNDNDYFKTTGKLHPIDMKIETLDDLIKLAKKYNPKGRRSM